MTFGFWDDNISIVAWDLPCKDNAMERCPSGLRSWSWKPVTPQGAVGSNPTFSAVSTGILIEYRLLVSLFGEVPKRLKGLPWKGSRSLIAARGFKSLLLRYTVSWFILCCAPQVRWWHWRVLIFGRESFLQRRSEDESLQKIKKLKKSVDNIEKVC